MQNQSITKFMTQLSPTCTCVALITLCACIKPEQTHYNFPRWAAYYHMQAPLSSLLSFDLLVLDSEHHPKLAPLKAAQIPLLGYISVGEVRDPETKRFLSSSSILGKNPHWDSYIVDVRDPKWADYIVNKAVPAALARGFDGVMLDTMDSPLHLESTNPRTYQGMSESLIHIVQRIRKKHPNIKIMVNRAFEILPEIAPQIDMLLAESTLSHYDFESNEASEQPDAVYMQYVEKIHHARRLIPNLSVYTLDYWDMNDSTGVSHIYETQRKHGFVPYVTTPNLTIIHHESNASTMDPNAMGLSKMKGRFDA